MKSIKLHLIVLVIIVIAELIGNIVINVHAENAQQE